MEDNYWDDLAQVGPQKPLGYLRAHAGLLAECGWPTDPASFVATVANNFAADDRLYELVGRAFADDRFVEHSIPIVSE